MTLSTDGGTKAMCAVCGHPIKHSEQGGAVFDGQHLRHADCVRDRYGYEAAKDLRWVQESRRERAKQTMLWANFSRRPPGRYGARRVA